MLAALAAALRLGDGERTHLAKLAAIAHSRELCPEATPLADDVAPGVRHLIDQLGSTPAFVVGPIGDVVARNDAWERVVAALGMLDDPPVNLARYVFLHPRARASYRDWDAAADEQVARLRAAEPRWGAEPAFAALLAELLGVDVFASRWSTHPVAEKRRGTKDSSTPRSATSSSRTRCCCSPTTISSSSSGAAADDATAERLVALVRDSRPVSPAQLSVVVNR